MQSRLEHDGNLIRSDVPCVACGYLLRGLASDQACPECGTAVLKSTGERSILLADASYLGSIRLGLVLVVLGFIADAVWLGAIPLLFSQIGSSLIPTFKDAWVLVLVIDAVGSVLSLVGWWLVTSPDPSIAHDVKRPWVMRAMRWLVVMLAVIAIAGFVGQMVPALANTSLGALAGNLQIGPATVFSPLFVAVLVVRGLAAIAKVVRFVLSFYVIAQLAKEIPDAVFARKARRGLWRVVLWAALGSVIVVGPLVAIYVYMSLLFGLRKRLEKQG